MRSEYDAGPGFTMQALNRSIRSRVSGLAALIALASLAALAQAHPGVGIVRDSHGNVYYTDLKQVWRIAPDGKTSVVVRDVHTHELWLDAEDNLYGEQLWYQGDATKKWAHRVWRLKPDGSLGDVVPARDGLLAEDFSFVRDRAGNMYWAEHGEKPALKRRAPDGTVRALVSEGLREVGWMTSTPDGVLYLMDQGDLRRVTKDGKLETVVERLSGIDPPPARLSERNYHMGLWLDPSGRICVAVGEESLVLAVDSQGKREIVARTPQGWRPSGGLYDKSGELWLLEYSSTNAVRVRHLAREGQEQVFGEETH